MPDTQGAARVAAVRRFNRAYTQQIGVLNEGLLHSPFSLTQVRVLYEIAHRENPAAAEFVKDLGLDRGYLSRILRSFERQGLVIRRRSQSDKRQNHLALTPKGRTQFARLDQRSDQEVAAMLARLSVPDQDRLVRAMSAIESLLSRPAAQKPPYVLRPPQPGDIGWIIHRHGALYHQEYGWDLRFEALVAEIAASFIQKFDPKRERCWIAHIEGEIAGCVFLVAKSKQVAQLRLLLVEPAARGRGLGKRLVGECLRFARQAGYKKIMLWTNDVLHAARRIYEQAGFRLVHEEPHDSFGHGLVGQNWELSL